METQKKTTAANEKPQAAKAVQNKKPRAGKSEIHDNGRAPQKTQQSTAKSSMKKQTAHPKQANASAKAAQKRANAAKEKVASAQNKAALAEKESTQAIKERLQAEKAAASKKKQEVIRKKEAKIAAHAKKKAQKEEAKKKKLALKQAKKAQKEAQKAAIKKEKAAKRQALLKQKAEAKKAKRAAKAAEKKARAEKQKMRAEKQSVHAEKAEARTAKQKAQAEKQEVRAEKAALKKQKKAMKAEKKRQKLAEKRARQRKEAVERQKKEQRRERQRENAQKDHRYIPNRGLTAAVIALGVTTLALASALTVYRSSAEIKIRSLDGVYARAFYDLVGSVDEMDSDLSKLSVSSSAGMERKLLTALTVEAEKAEGSLAELPLPEEVRYHAASLLNRIGDYARYLERSLDGGAMTERQREAVISLTQGVRTLQQNLHGVAGKMQGGKFRFSSLLSGKENPLLAGFKDLEKGSEGLPELIFDGPFSKGTENPDHAPRALSGATLDRVEAENALKRAFADYDLTDITFHGEGQDGPISAYSFTAKDGRGGDFYAQISKIGGKVLLFDSDCGEGNTLLSDDDCVNTAETFLAALGLKNLTAVWSDSYQNECTVNFAAETDGVICYPDLIKVKVCKTDGRVMGMEAFSYYLNHKSRQNLTPTMEKAKVQALLSKNLSVSSSRLCVAPLGRGKEELCYEFVGTANGQTYYVYLSAHTGREVQIFRVVEGTEGTMLS